MREVAEAARPRRPGRRRSRPRDRPPPRRLARRSPRATPRACPALKARAARVPERGSPPARRTCAGSGWRAASPLELWDDETWHELADRAVRLAREAGALTAASRRAHLPRRRARARRRVRRRLGAGRGGRRDHGGNRQRAPPLRLAGARRLARRARPGAGADRGRVQDAIARGEGGPRSGRYATAVLYNGLGRYEDALAAADGRAHEDLGLLGWALVELVEAAARSGAARTPPPPWGGSRSGPAPRAPTGRWASRPARARC